MQQREDLRHQLRLPFDQVLSYIQGAGFVKVDGREWGVGGRIPEMQ